MGDIALSFRGLKIQIHTCGFAYSRGTSGTIPTIPTISTGPRWHGTFPKVTL